MQPCFGDAVLLSNGSDKAQALARQRLDEPLLLAVVAERRAGGIDPGAERGFGDDAPCHTEASRSSLLTTRSRFRIRYSSRSKTCGSTATGAFREELAAIGIERVVLEQIAHVEFHGRM